MRKCAVLLAGLALFSSGCHFKTKDLLRALEASKAAPVTVTVSPSSASLSAYSTQQFTTTVTGTSNTQVTWRLGGPPCAVEQDCGSISAKGFYIAPGVIPNPNPITVTASAEIDALAAGAAQVTITPAVETQENLRGNYTFLVSGSDFDGTLSVAGKFVADGAGQLHSGQMSLCRAQAPCVEQAFAGGYTSSAKNQGSFWADALSEAKFHFALTESGVVNLQLDDSKGLHATGIMESAKDISKE
ncbi:MAG TPA: hypothetical protein VKH63_23905 [Candidatus Acidoferrum sp.]|jgi:hypothetical protein|nr:hypothetical protein [Candidatus Acidoferrum sp.]